MTKCAGLRFLSMLRALFLMLLKLLDILILHIVIGDASLQFLLDFGERIVLVRDLFLEFSNSGVEPCSECSLRNFSAITCKNDLSTYLNLPLFLHLIQRSLQLAGLLLQRVFL